MWLKEYGLTLTEERHPSLIEEHCFSYGNIRFSSPSFVVEMINSCIALNRKAEKYLYMVALS